MHFDREPFKAKSSFCKSILNSMEQSKNLFGVAVNSSGKEFIRRFAKLVKWIIVFGILISFVELGAIFIRLFYLRPLLKGNSLMGFANLAESSWIVGYLILLGLQ